MPSVPQISDQFVIYGIRLTHDATYEYRYVGLTSTPTKRFKAHLAIAANKNSKKYMLHRYCWIRKHFFNVSFDILEVCSTYEELNFSEKKWINILSTRGHRLTNHTLGGEGAVGHIHTENSRNKMRENHWSKNGYTHPRLGSKLSQDTKDKISFSLLLRSESNGIPPKTVNFRKPAKLPKAVVAKFDQNDLKEWMSLLHSGEGNPFFGKTHTKESIEKQIKAQTGQKKKVTYSTCPHCGLFGGGGNMTRYHFNNCKSSPSTSERPCNTLPS